jgi:copper(I)-binding protein
MHRMLLIIAGFVSVSTPLAAHDYTVGSITVDHPWSRATPPAAPVAGGYLTVINAGPEADRLLRVDSPAATEVQIHQSSIEDGVARMRPVVDGLEVAAGQTLELKPGGTHLMFIKPAKAFADKDKVRARLTFAKAGSIEVEFRVQAMGAATPAASPHADHMVKP